MAGQATMNGRSEPRVQMSRHAGVLLRDLMTLAELQVRLFFADARIASRFGKQAGMFLAVALLVGLSGATVLFLALAAFLWEFAGLSLGASLLITATAAIAVAAAALGWAFHAAGEMTRSFARSASELDLNLRWAKATLAAQTKVPDNLSRRL